MGSNPTAFFNAEVAKNYNPNSAEVTLIRAVCYFRVFT